MYWKLYLLEYKRLLRRPWLVAFMFSLYIIYALLIIFAINLLNGLDIFRNSSLPLVDYLKFPLSWATASWLASYIVPLWVIFVIIFLDDREMVMDNNFLHKKTFIAKLGLAFTIPLDWTLTSLLAGWLLGLHWGRGDIHFINYQTIGLFMQLVSYIAMALLFFIIFRSALKTIFAFLGYFVLEAVVRKILLSLNIFIAYYLPAKVITSLVAPPAASYISGAKYNDFIGQIPLPFWVNVIISVFYTIVFIALTLYLIKSKSN